MLPSYTAVRLIFVMSDDDKFTVYCICLYIKDKQSNFLPLLVNTVVVITEVWHAANDKVCMETY